MNSEWMRVMLDEIARKKAEAEQSQIELERRVSEGLAPVSRPGTPKEMPEGNSPRSPASE